MCMAAQASQVASVLPSNPVTAMSLNTINAAKATYAPVTKPVEKAVGIKPKSNPNAATLMVPTAFGATGLQIPQG